MAVKRRVIWMSDEEWNLFRAQAQEHNTTVSGLLRDMWNLAARVQPADAAEVARIEARAGPILREDVDDHYGGVAPPGRKVLEPTARPFTEFRPVPKPSRKR